MLCSGSECYGRRQCFVLFYRISELQDNKLLGLSMHSLDVMQPRPGQLYYGILSWQFLLKTLEPVVVPNLQCQGYVWLELGQRVSLTTAGSAKGKPQFATKPGSTKGKGPSSPLAWVNKRQGLRFVTVYSVSIYLSYGIFVEMSLKASRVLLK